MAFALTHIICGVVLERDGAYLLVQERQPKAYGLWNLPAGKVDEGETLEQAAAREASEETGFDVALKQHLYVLHPEAHRPVMHAFAADITGGELHIPQEELLDAQWFTFDQIQAMQDKLRNAEYVLGAIRASQL